MLKRSCKKWTSNHLPNLELLSLRNVLAFPKASSTGFALNNLASMSPPPVSAPATSDKYLKHVLVVSVLPAPDSPDIKIACVTRSEPKFL